MDIKSVILPTTRKIIPKILPEQIISQPISHEVLDDLIDVQVSEGNKLAFGKCKKNCFGDIIHSFIHGPMIFDGKTFIPVHEFKDRYPDILYSELFNMKGHKFDANSFRT